MPRVRVQDLAVGTQGFSPGAAPVDQYRRPSRSQSSIVQDLAPLSATLNKVALQHAEERKQAEVARGRGFAIENPSLAAELSASTEGINDPEKARQAFIGAYNKLVQGGKITESSSPLFQIGFAEASSRQLLTNYRIAVNQRVQETATLVDADGNPAEPVAPERIMEEEWSKIAGNVAVRDTFGRRVADGLKAQHDEEFKARSADAYNKAMETRTRGLITTQLSERFDTLSLADDVTPQMLGEMRDFITEAVHDKTMRNPRGIVMDALRQSVRRAGNADAENGLRLLEDVADMRVGGVRLSEDSTGGEKSSRVQIEKLKRQLQDQAESDVLQDLQNIQREQALAVEERRGGWVTGLTDALDDPNASVAALRQTMEDTIDEEFESQPELRGIVLQKFREQADKLSASQRTDPEMLNDFELALASGDTASARAIFESSMSDPESGIRGADAREMVSALQGQESLVKQVEGFAPFNAFRESTGASRDNLSQFSRGVREQYEDAHDALRRNFTQRYIDFARGNQDPNALRGELDRLTGEFNDQIEQVQGKFSEGRLKTQERLGDAVAHRVDATELIERAHQDGRIDAHERLAALEQNRRGQDRSDLFREEEYRVGLSQLDNVVEGLGATALPAEATDAQVDAFQLEIQSAGLTIRTRYRAAAEEWLNSNLATTDPSKLKTAFAAATPGFLEEAREGAQEAFSEALQTRTESLSVPAETQQRVSEGAQWAQKFPAGSGRIDANDPLIRRHPAVRPGVYEKYAKFASREKRSLFEDPLRKHEIQDDFARESFRLLDDPGNVKGNQRAIQGMYALTGIPAEDVLKGALTVRRSDQFRTSSLSTLALEQAQKNKDLGFQTYFGMGIDDFISRSEGTLTREEEVPLEVGDINPYATPVWQSKGEMSVWENERHDDYEKLLKALGVDGDDAGELNRFRAAQLEAIRRNRP